jgi:hypothetical protein
MTAVMNRFSRVARGTGGKRPAPTRNLAEVRFRQAVAVLYTLREVWGRRKIATTPAGKKLLREFDDILRGISSTLPRRPVAALRRRA